MNAVAMITPDPKYFAMKKAQSETLRVGWRRAMTGNNAPASMSELKTSDLVTAYQTSFPP